MCFTKDKSQTTTEQNMTQNKETIRYESYFRKQNSGTQQLCIKMIKRQNKAISS